MKRTFAKSRYVELSWQSRQQHTASAMRAQNRDMRRDHIMQESVWGPGTE